MSNMDSPAEMLNVLHDMHQRGQESAAKLSQDDTHGAWTAIGFRIANTHLLIPLDEASEVFTVPSQITPVPKSQPWVFGIANLRGALLPLFDLKYFLYGQATKVNKRSRIVVSNHSHLYSGLLLDEVFGLKHFPTKPESNSISSDDPISQYISAHIEQKDIQWDVFSFEKLAADPRFLNAAA